MTQETPVVPFQGNTLSASLTVEDLQKSVAWYRDVLRFESVQTYERDGKLMAVSMKAGRVAILLSQDTGEKGWGRTKGEGFSLQITTDEDIDELAARIRAHGVVLGLEPTNMPWGARVFRLQDPDGFRYAISSERPATT